jgi:glycosyltransferase involved in cell wall biosynthesis
MNAQPIRVLQLGSPTGLYGAERWILALVKHLSAADIESFVATIQDAPGDVPPLCRQAAALGLRTATFDAHGRLSLAAVRLINAFIRANRISILHTHGYKTDLLGWAGARGTRCRVISTPHGWSTQAGIKLKLYEALDRLGFVLMDAVVPLSADLYAELRGLPVRRGKLHLIENGVDLAELDTPAAPAAELTPWKESGCTIIGYIGQLIPRKGLDTLIRAFSALSGAKLRLCIVGEGPQRPELESLAARLGETQRVHFLGYRADRIALLKGFDAFVLPSALEGTPRSLLEAMAAGVPVIGSDIPGCRTLIEPGRTGLLFHFGDATGLAQALRRLLAETNERAARVEAAKDLVRTRFSAEQMAVRYAALYRQVMS